MVVFVLDPFGVVENLDFGAKGSLRLNLDLMEPMVHPIAFGTNDDHHW